MSDHQPEANQEAVDIEAIMREVRAEIIRQSVDRDQNAARPAVTESRDIADFFLFLYQARLAYDVTDVDLEVNRISLPLVGPILTRLRQTLHELVLFYVLKLATRQKEFNRQVLDALTTLGGIIESGAASESAGD